MMGLRRVRSEVSIVRKEGVVRNGTEKARILFWWLNVLLIISIAGKGARGGIPDLGDGGDGWLGALLQLLLVQRGAAGCRSGGEGMCEDWLEMRSLNFCRLLYIRILLDDIFCISDHLNMK